MAMPPPPDAPIGEYNVFVKAVTLDSTPVSGATLTLYNTTKGTNVVRVSSESNSNVAISLADCGIWNIGDTIHVKAVYSGNEQDSGNHTVQSADNGKWDADTIAITTANPAPTVIDNSPTGTTVPITTQISVTFDMAMNEVSAQAAFSTVPNTTGTFGWVGNVMTFTPDTNLSYVTQYEVTVGTGAQSALGVNMAAPHVWSFTTCSDSGGVAGVKTNHVDELTSGTKVLLHNLKSHVDSTLSGTPIVIEIDDNGTPYYFKVYPNK